MEECDELGRDIKKNKAHRKLFTQKVKNNFYDSEDDDYDSEEDSEDSEDMANNRAD
jgi:hypothetical protein